MMTPSDSNASLQVDVLVDDGISLPAQIEQIVDAVVAAARYRGCCQGEVGVRVTDDAEIQQINRTHLQHDYPTDVISFGYRYEPPLVEGELVVSVETAAGQSRHWDWPVSHELILYVVHGTLHLCGMDDQDPGPRAEMRKAESEIMKKLGITEIARCGADQAVQRDQQTVGDHPIVEERA